MVQIVFLFAKDSDLFRLVTVSFVQTLYSLTDKLLQPYAFYFVQFKLTALFLRILWVLYVKVDWTKTFQERITFFFLILENYVKYYRSKVLKRISKRWRDGYESTLEKGYH